MTALLDAAMWRPLQEVDPLSVWTAYRVGLHVVSVFAFLSLFFQTRIFHRLNVPEWRLERAKETFGQWRAFHLYPTLLWLSPSQKSSGNICGLAVVLNIIALVGWVSSWKVFLFSYVAYLSVDVVFDLHLPWDMLIMEMLFWSSFLPADNKKEPAVAISVIIRTMFLKVMLGFAKTKFSKSRVNLSRFYIREFLVAMPLPSRLGLVLHRYPREELFFMMLIMMAISEIVAPIVGIMPFMPLAMRIFAFLASAGLMLGINLTGSFGHFNILTSILSLPQLVPINHDIGRYNRDPSVYNDWFWAIPYILLCLVQSNVGSGVSTSWPFIVNEVSTIAPGNFVKRLAAVFRAITPFRICNAYGVFPPHSCFPGRALPIIEVEFKGKWISLKFPYLPVSCDDDPYLISPGLYFHTPRLEMKMFYQFRGMGFEGLEGVISRADDPQTFSPESTLLDRLAQRLLEGDHEVMSYFRQHSSSAAGLYRASKVRVGWALFMATGTHVKFNPGVHTSVGKYYTTLPLPGYVLRTTGRNPDVWEAYVPFPLLFHFCARPWLELTDVISTAKYVASSVAEEELEDNEEADGPAFIPPALVDAKSDIIWSRSLKRYDGKQISETLVGITRQDALDALRLFRSSQDKWETERGKMLEADRLAPPAGPLTNNISKHLRLRIAANLLTIAKAYEVAEEFWSSPPGSIRSVPSWWHVSFIAQSQLAGSKASSPPASSPELWSRILPEMHRRRALVGKVARQVLDPFNYRDLFENEQQMQRTPSLKDRKAASLKNLQRESPSSQGTQNDTSDTHVNLSAFMDHDGSWTLL